MTAWSDTIAPGAPIAARAIEELRAAIRAEIVGRRKLGAFTPVDEAVTPDMPVKAAHTQELITQLDKVSPQGVSVAPGDLIQTTTLNLLRANINTYEAAPQFKPGSSGCNAGCTGLCTSCTGTCTGGCTSCSSCSGCSGCGSGCANGCSGCSGCSGCGSGCSSSCTGGCKTGCSSCSGTCKGTCSGCTGTCKGGCEGGCSSDCTGHCTSGCSNLCVAACRSYAT